MIIQGNHQKSIVPLKPVESAYAKISILRDRVINDPLPQPELFPYTFRDLNVRILLETVVLGRTVKKWLEALKSFIKKEDILKTLITGSSAVFAANLPFFRSALERVKHPEIFEKELKKKDYHYCDIDIKVQVKKSVSFAKLESIFSQMYGCVINHSNGAVLIVCIGGKLDIAFYKELEANFGFFIDDFSINLTGPDLLIESLHPWDWLKGHALRLVENEGRNDEKLYLRLLGKLLKGYVCTEALQDDLFENWYQKFLTLKDKTNPVKYLLDRQWRLHENGVVISRYLLSLMVQQSLLDRDIEMAREAAVIDLEGEVPPVIRLVFDLMKDGDIAEVHKALEYIALKALCEGWKDPFYVRVVRHQGRLVLRVRFPGKRDVIIPFNPKATKNEYAMQILSSLNITYRPMTHNYKKSLCQLGLGRYLPLELDLIWYIDDDKLWDEVASECAKSLPETFKHLEPKTIVACYAPTVERLQSVNLTDLQKHLLLVHILKEFKKKNPDVLRYLDISKKINWDAFIYDVRSPEDFLPYLPLALYTPLFHALRPSDERYHTIWCEKLLKVKTDKLISYLEKPQVRECLRLVKSKAVDVFMKVAETRRGVDLALEVLENPPQRLLFRMLKSLDLYVAEKVLPRCKATKPEYKAILNQLTEKILAEGNVRLLPADFPLPKNLPAARTLINLIREGFVEQVEAMFLRATDEEIQSLELFEELLKISRNKAQLLLNCRVTSAVVIQCWERTVCDTNQSINISARLLRHGAEVFGYNITQIAQKVFPNFAPSREKLDNDISKYFVTIVNDLEMWDALRKSQKIDIEDLWNTGLGLLWEGLEDEKLARWIVDNVKNEENLLLYIGSLGWAVKNPVTAKALVKWTLRQAYAGNKKAIDICELRCNMQIRPRSSDNLAAIPFFGLLFVILKLKKPFRFIALFILVYSLIAGIYFQAQALRLR